MKHLTVRKLLCALADAFSFVRAEQILNLGRQVLGDFPNRSEDVLWEVVV